MNNKCHGCWALSWLSDGEALEAGTIWIAIYIQDRTYSWWRNHRKILYHYLMVHWFNNILIILKINYTLIISVFICDNTDDDLVHSKKKGQGFITERTMDFFFWLN